MAAFSAQNPFDVQALGLGIHLALSFLAMLKETKEPKFPPSEAYVEKV